MFLSCIDALTPRWLSDCTTRPPYSNGESEREGKGIERGERKVPRALGIEILRCQTGYFFGAGNAEVYPSGVEEDAEIYFYGGRVEEGVYFGGEDGGFGVLHFWTVVVVVVEC